MRRGCAPRGRRDQESIAAAGTTLLLLPEIKRLQTMVFRSDDFPRTPVLELLPKTTTTLLVTHVGTPPRRTRSMASAID